MDCDAVCGGSYRQAHRIARDQLTQQIHANAPQAHSDVWMNGMEYETLIVAYGQVERASAAIKALRRHGVPSDCIKRHPVSAESIEDIATAPEPPTGTGFFGWLFGRDALSARIELYKKALEAGGTVISVKVQTEETGRVHKLLQDFGPLDWEVAPGKSA